MDKMLEKIDKEIKSKERSYHEYLKHCQHIWKRSEVSRASKLSYINGLIKAKRIVEGLD